MLDGLGIGSKVVKMDAIDEVDDTASINVSTKSIHLFHPINHCCFFCKEGRF